MVWGFCSISRMTPENMSHSTWANARKTCSLVRRACSRRRASSIARSTTRCALSPILLGEMSRSSTCTGCLRLIREQQFVRQPWTVAFRPQIRRSFPLVPVQQRFYPLFGRRMCAEQPKQALGRKGLDDEQVRRGWVSVQGDSAGSRLNLPQGAHQAVRPDECGASRVGVVLARPRNRGLNQCGRYGSEHEHGDEGNGVAAFPIVAPAPAEEHGKARHHQDRRRERGGDGTDKDVAMLHVGELVRKHALELIVSQD